MPIQKVTKGELAAKDVESDRCAIELADDRVDALGYVSLVGIVSMGNRYLRMSEERQHLQTVETGAPPHCNPRRRIGRRPEHPSSQESLDPGFGNRPSTPDATA
jgi:hypothetical protein